MARARNIKPGFYKNEDLAECSVWARLMFPGLWMLADREGRLEDRPKRIKAELFPFDSIEVDPLLDELKKWGFILRYEVDGCRFIQLVNFTKHQTPHVKEADSIIPAPCTNSAETKQAPDKHSASTVQAPDKHQIKLVLAPPDSLNPSSLNPKPYAHPVGFAEFWSAYPRKKNKGDAEKAWLKLKPDVALRTAILEAVEVARVSDDWRKDGGQFIPYPASWLRAKGWEDETAVTEPIQLQSGGTFYEGIGVVL